MEEIIIDRIKDVQGKDEFSYYGSYYNCKKCMQNIIPYYKYCSNCGSKIKWVDAKNNT